MPHDVFEAFLAVQQVEVEYRVKRLRKVFTGELHTTVMFQRAFHFSDNPKGSFLHRVVMNKLAAMKEHPKTWIVRFFLCVSPYGMKLTTVASVYF